ncbi:hypothetical protein F751_3633 [Auxenochlorella protothecoides]|uniref:Uncharacterized protein n=1 Tax=Auxenochlorella protothecoides TaxID=3075 RepID=A0A087SJU1_AUXPR|nr:hypothetical protein F751_3633 [Auxenochlorella protothecoides]KFM25995.1 hypothetical protein F751_3633 [Auxenochlorella protothecoides]
MITPDPALPRPVIAWTPSLTSPLPAARPAAGPGTAGTASSSPPRSPPSSAAPPPRPGPARRSQRRTAPAAAPRPRTATPWTPGAPPCAARAARAARRRRACCPRQRTPAPRPAPRARPGHHTPRGGRRRGRSARAGRRGRGAGGGGTRPRAAAWRPCSTRHPRPCAPGWGTTVRRTPRTRCCAPCARGCRAAACPRSTGPPPGVWG